MATANKNLPEKRWVRVSDAPATWVFASCNKSVDDVIENFKAHDEYVLINGKKIPKKEFYKRKNSNNEK
jgi:hypothetical protein